MIDPIIFYESETLALAFLSFGSETSANDRSRSVEQLTRRTDQTGRKIRQVLTIRNFSGSDVSVEIDHFDGSEIAVTTSGDQDLAEILKKNSFKINLVK